MSVAEASAPMSTAVCYPPPVSFDIARAVTETFGSRTPLLDRILSYLYFADVTVVEQSTADAWGSGVTVIGLKGEAEGAPGLVLAGCLPTLRLFPGSPRDIDDAGGHPRDLYRLVDLLARVFALSILDPGQHQARLGLLAYRPDPVAEALHDLAVSPFFAGMDWLLSAPTGLEPGPLASDVVVVEARLSSGGRRGPAHRFRNVVSARARASDADPAFPFSALQDLADLVTRGHATVLDLEPCAGSDFLAPAEVDVVLGVIREPLLLPETWRVLPETRPTVRLGPWLEVVRTVLDLSEGLGSAVKSAWTATGSPPPEPPVRLVALRGTCDDCSVFLAADLPRLDPPGRERVRGTLDTAIAGARDSACRGMVGPSIVRWPAFSPSGDVRALAMGPIVDEVWQDPVAAARRAADAYVEAVSGLLRGRAP